jgi:Tfp pilus assembly protein PilX
MSNRISHRRQRGAALVIGLILLAIITLLAVVGMNMSNSELQSATSEQLRLRSFQAAETGVERAFMDLTKDIGTAKGAYTTDPVTAVESSPTNPATGLPQDSYQTIRKYFDESSLVEGASLKVHAFHYTVTSTGTSARNASSQIIQGAYILNTVENPPL